MKWRTNIYPKIIAKRYSKFPILLWVNNCNYKMYKWFQSFVNHG